jgi:hypothetical protein
LNVPSAPSTLVEEFKRYIEEALHPPPPAIRAAIAASTLLELTDKVLELVCVAAMVASVVAELFERTTLEV